jgi:phage shock protein E
MLSRLSSKILALCLACAIPLVTSASEPLWIDVRSAQEYSDGHVEQATNIPHNEIAAGISELTTDKDATIYVYCRSGRRSGIAQDTLEGMGYTQVTNIGGLEDALEKSGQESSH